MKYLRTNEKAETARKLDPLTGNSTISVAQANLHMHSHALVVDSRQKSLAFTRPPTRLFSTSFLHDPEHARASRARRRQAIDGRCSMYEVCENNSRRTTHKTPLKVDGRPTKCSDLRRFIALDKRVRLQSFSPGERAEHQPRHDQHRLVQLRKLVSNEATTLANSAPARGSAWLSHARGW